MSAISRRQFARDTLGTLLTMSLLETVFQNELLGADVRPAAAQWASRYRANGRGSERAEARTACLAAEGRRVVPAGAALRHSQR